MQEANAVYLTEAQIDDYYDAQREKYLKRYYLIQEHRRMQESRGRLVRLVLLSILTLIVCTIFLRFSFQVQQQTYRVSVLQKEIAALQQENEDAEKRMEDTMERDEVTEIASELGMDYPQAGSVVYYSIEDSDYMLQTQEIPDN